MSCSQDEETDGRTVVDESSPEEDGFCCISHWRHQWPHWSPNHLHATDCYKVVCTKILRSSRPRSTLEAAFSMGPYNSIFDCLRAALNGRRFIRCLYRKGRGSCSAYIKWIVIHTMLDIQRVVVHTMAVSARHVRH